MARGVRPPFRPSSGDGARIQEGRVRPRPDEGDDVGSAGTGSGDGTSGSDVGRGGARRRRRPRRRAPASRFSGSIGDPGDRVALAAARLANGSVFAGRRGPWREPALPPCRARPSVASGTGPRRIGRRPGTGASGGTVSVPGATTRAGIVLKACVRLDRNDGSCHAGRVRRMAPPTRRPGASGSRA